MILFSSSLHQLRPIAINALRHYKFWPEIKGQNPFMPPNKETRLLPVLPTTPMVWPSHVDPPVKHPKAWKDMRGPERVHNQLIYGQFGIIALGGGSLHSGHLDVIRSTINRHIDSDRFFAVWRIDPPWKAVSKKGLGKKMGGGKSKVHHYETPIKAGRIIVEIAGSGEYGEVQRYLNNVCQLLPIDAMAISQEIMDNLEREKRHLDSINYNPFKFRECVRKNYSDSRRHMDKYEVAWGGEYF